MINNLQSRWHTTNGTPPEFQEDNPRGGFVAGWRHLGEQGQEPTLHIVTITTSRSTSSIMLSGAFNATGFLQGSMSQHSRIRPTDVDLFLPDPNEPFGNSLVFQTKTIGQGRDRPSGRATATRLKVRKTGEVQFFERLLQIWGLDERQGATLLGFEQASHVRDLLSGAVSLRRRDAQDRLKNLIEIRAALDKLYRDEDVEREWLREPNPYLEGSKPLDILLEGSMEGLLRVRQFVEYLSGR